MSESGTGICVTTSTYSSTSQIINGRTWVRSANENVRLNWWSAQNWCQRQKASNGTTSLQMASLSDVGCGEFSSGQSCTNTGNSGFPGKTGSALAALQNGGWTSGYHWLSNNDENALIFESSSVSNLDKDFYNFALCTCPTIANCTSYNSDCSCAKVCSATDGACLDNSDCCNSTDFCSWSGAGGVNTSTGKPNASSGICTPLSTYGNGTGTNAKTLSVRGTTIEFISSSSNVNWWTAKNWCECKGMVLSSRDDLGCGDLSQEYCSQSGYWADDGMEAARKGSVLEAMQNSGWNNMAGWLNDEGESTPYTAYRVDTNTTLIFEDIRDNAHFPALCRACDTSGCATNDGCRCLTCPSGRTLSSGLCMCPAIANCTSYNSDCTCATQQ